jgi:putative intracellular protease/amidase
MPSRNMVALDRRSLLLLGMAASFAAVTAAATASTLSSPASSPAPDPMAMSKLNASSGAHGNEVIALLAYPGFTLLDLVGPHYMLGNMLGATVHIVARTTDPVHPDMGPAIVPTISMNDCPADLTLLMIPGGTRGTLAAMQDDATITFLQDRARRARWMTSVCTGALVLGAAGLLRGYRATSHWVVRDLLSDFGAIPTDERVVFDRDRITGSGVTAGLDFGLSVVSELRGVPYAQAVALLAEYDPAPPVHAGTPRTAPTQTTQMLREMLAPFVDQARAHASKGVAT